MYPLSTSLSRGSEGNHRKTEVWVQMQVSKFFNKQKGQQAKTKQYSKPGHHRRQHSAIVPSAKTECTRSGSRNTVINLHIHTHVRRQSNQTGWCVRTEYKSSYNGKQLRMCSVTGVWNEGKMSPGRREMATSADEREERRPGLLTIVEFGQSQASVCGYMWWNVNSSSNDR